MHLCLLVSFRIGSRCDSLFPHFFLDRNIDVLALAPKNPVAKSLNTGSHGLRVAQDGCVLGFFIATRQQRTVLVHRPSKLALQVR
jgi:hypothetical protein